MAIIRGVTANGSVVYYTGRAGDGWISPEKSEAFQYALPHARQRAVQFNRNTSLHGIHFMGIKEDHERLADGDDL